MKRPKAIGSPPNGRSSWRRTRSASSTIRAAASGMSSATSRAVARGSTSPGVGRPKQALRRRAGVPHARFGRVAGRQPERVIDHASAALGERRRLRRLLPRLAGVERAEHGRAEVAGARGGQHDLCVAGIGNRVMDDVTEELRSGELPGAARQIARERPESLAGRDEQADTLSRHRSRGFLGAWHVEGRPCALTWRRVEGRTLRRERIPRNRRGCNSSRALRSSLARGGAASAAFRSDPQ